MSLTRVGWGTAIGLMLLSFLGCTLPLEAGQDESLGVGGARLNLAPNASFERDLKRLGGWLPVGVLPADGTGRIEITPDAAFDGNRSLRVVPGPFPEEGEVRGQLYFADYNGGEGVRTVSRDQGVTGARTIALRLEPSVESMEASVWIRRSTPDPCSLTATWSTRRDRRPVVELHRDSTASPREHRGDWEKLALRVPRPAGAVQVQLAITTSGRASFHVDAVELLFQRRPEQRLLINQLGFEPESRAKRVVLQSSQPLVSPPVARVMEVESFREVLPLRWEEHGYHPELDYYYWSADFSDLKAAGRYLVAAGEGPTRIDSTPFLVQPELLLRGTGRAAYRFYYEQRCGVAVPGVHAACHLDDGRLPDGTLRDLSGGWHDAGDYNKYNGLTPEALRMLGLAFQRNVGFFQALDEDRNGLADMADEIAWGARWLDKMLNPETLQLWNQVFSGYRFWGPPESETDNRPGTGDERPVQSDQGDRRHLAAGYAWLAQALAESGNEEHQATRRRYTELASRLQEAAGGDLLTLEALHAATGNPTFRERAQARAQTLWGESGAQAEANFGELARFAIAREDQALMSQLRPLANRRVQALAERCVAPFFAARRPIGDGTLAYCRAYEDVNDWYVGETAYRLEVAVEALLAAQLGADEGRRLAEHQVNWILGCNPAGLSLMEGVGSAFVPGYHHRYNAIPGNPRGAVTGAILNGFVRAFPHVDRPWLDLWEMPNADYHSNEPWLLQNNRWLEVLAWW